METRYSDFGPLNITNYEIFLKTSKETFHESWKKKVSYDIKLKDFEPIILLGQGKFGTVVLVKNKVHQANCYYAMKVISKRKVIQKKQVENTKTEKDFMQSINHPLMIHLDFFFQDNLYLYFIMPHVPGGDLFTHLREIGRFEEEDSVFYAAQIVLAIEYMHYINFIHRDIKPENILIDHRGYLKLSDFGFSKRLEKDRTYTFCGTPEYIAPEVVMQKGYGLSADWWSVGVLIYELCAGYSPFYSKNTKRVFKKISAAAFRMPLFFSKDLRDLVNNLLQANPIKRYGNLKNGADDIKNHEWFRTTNWLAILNRKIDAPYKPIVTNIDEIKCGVKLNLLSSEVDIYQEIFASF